MFLMFNKYKPGGYIYIGINYTLTENSQFDRNNFRFLKTE